MIGIDPDIISRDEHMAQTILRNLDANNINLFFAHNAHVDNRVINEPYETKWHNEKYRCGYYLIQNLGDRYCIILSTAYHGQIRYDCKCNNKTCDIRDPLPIPVYQQFEIDEYKDIQTNAYPRIEIDQHVPRLTHLAEFTACIFPHTKPTMVKTDPQYVIFINQVKPLSMIPNTQ